MKAALSAMAAAMAAVHIAVDAPGLHGNEGGKSGSSVVDHLPTVDGVFSYKYA